MLYIIDLYEEGDFYADNIYTVCLYLYINKYTSWLYEAAMNKEGTKYNKNTFQ